MNATENIECEATGSVLIKNESRLEIDTKKKSKRKESLVGEIYGRLKVIKQLKGSPGRRNWECVCECGNIKVVPTIRLRDGRTRSCGCIRDEYEDSLRKNMPYIQYGKWKGVGEISMTYFNALRRGAINRNLEFSIDLNYIWALYIDQNKKCALSGEIICFSRNIKSREQTASLDRIDSNIGYIIGNVQWVHKDVNRIKMGMTQEKFVDLCVKIANNTKHYGTTK